MAKISSKASLTRALDEMIKDERDGAKNYLVLRRAIKRSFPKSRMLDVVLTRIKRIAEDEREHYGALKRIKATVKKTGLV